MVVSCWFTWEAKPYVTIVAKFLKLSLIIVFLVFNIGYYCIKYISASFKSYLLLLKFHIETGETMSYSIDIDRNKKLIRYQHKGFIVKEEIGKAWNEFLTLNEFTHQNFNLLSDYREAKFNIEIHEVDLICGFLRSISNIVSGKKQALVLHEPLSTALSILFGEKVNEQIGFKVKVFSTKTAAIKWLLE
jgi:hypothetical protein